jgi:hypothetical protein
LIADESGLYWTETNGGTADVWFLPIPHDGAAPRSAWHLEDGTVHAIALDAESIYIAFWPGHGGASLLRRSKRGGPISTLATDISVENLQYSDGAIYVTARYNLTSFAIDGSRPPLELARFDDYIHHVEVGADHVYFSNNGANLARVRKTGGAIEAITLPGTLGFWTVRGHWLYVDLDDKIVRVDTTTLKAAPVALGATGTVRGIADDKIIVQTGSWYDAQLQGLSLTTGELTPPVSMRRPSEGINVSAGAVWWMRKIRDSHDVESYQLVMYVP